MNARMIVAVGSFVMAVSASAFAQNEQIANDGAPETKLRAQAQIEVLPVGSAKQSEGGQSMSMDTDVAYGISGAVDYAVTPYLSVGAAPRLVLNVKPKDAADGVDAAKQIDLRARVLAHFQVQPKLELYASLAPGYSIITSSVDGVDSATGFAIAGAVGATYDVAPRVFLSGEVGYQRVFASQDIDFGGAKQSVDFDLSYMHIGLGAGTRF
jgi:outer membrane protein W